MSSVAWHAHQYAESGLRSGGATAHWPSLVPPLTALAFWGQRESLCLLGAGGAPQLRRPQWQHSCGAAVRPCQRHLLCGVTHLGVALPSARANAAPSRLTQTDRQADRQFGRKTHSEQLGPVLTPWCGAAVHPFNVTHLGLTLRRTARRRYRGRPEGGAGPGLPLLDIWSVKLTRYFPAGYHPKLLP